MSEKLEQFKQKVENAENAPLLDSLIQHVPLKDKDFEHRDAMKIIKTEVLKRMNAGTL